jgi:hypothetical protein
MHYPTATKATISLFVADGPEGYWLQHRVIFYDDKLLEQPTGQLSLYLSDFLGAQGLPTAYCRPSAAEMATGISRFVLPFVPLVIDSD